MIDDLYFQSSPNDPKQPGLFDKGDNAKETRRVALAASIPHRVSRRDRIESFIRDRGRIGATRDEISAELGLPIQSVCPPVLAMLRSGRIIETPKRRNTRAGKPAAVMVINPNRGSDEQ